VTVNGNNVFDKMEIYGFPGSFFSELFWLLLFRPPLRKDMIFNDNHAAFSRKMRSNAFIYTRFVYIEMKLFPNIQNQFPCDTCTVHDGNQTHRSMIIIVMDILCDLLHQKS